MLSRMRVVRLSTPFRDSGVILETSDVMSGKLWSAAEFIFFR
jgi:hypothetical protein